jgi:3-oxoacyl-ACP reductase-like protein
MLILQSIILVFLVNSFVDSLDNSVEERDGKDFKRVKNNFKSKYETILSFEKVNHAMNFTGKVVLVTGSSSGIGAETVRLFSYLGAQVVVTGRNRTRINQVAYDCYQLSPYKLKVI